MIGLGTIINGSAVVVGGLCGLLFKRFLNERIENTVTKACGIPTLFMGIYGAMSQMQQNGSRDMVVILSFVIGSILGEIINIEGKLEQFGEWLKKKSNNEKDSQFLDAFITTSLTICIGAMAIVGSINDGLYGDYSIFLAKSVLDFIIVMVLTSSKGKGSIFAFIPVVLFQGSITLLAVLIEPIMTEAALANISLIGSMLIFCIGVNLIWDSMHIKVANMLPAIIIGIIAAFI